MISGNVCLKVNECTNLLGFQKDCVNRGESLTLKDCSDIVTPYFPHTEIIQRDLLRTVQCCVCFARQCGASTMFICLVPFTMLFTFVSLICTECESLFD